MIAALHMVRNPLQRLRNSVRKRLKQLRLVADIAANIDELDELEQEVRLMLQGDESWVSKSTLAQLFYAEVSTAREQFLAGNNGLACKHRSSAKATRICIERNLRHELPTNGIPVFN